MLLQLIGIVQNLVEKVVHSVLVTLIYLALLLAVGHYFGWVERWIWFVLESESKKILNSTNVTMGSFQLDWSNVLQGKIILHASNVVIHTPRRDEWMWESPLIARVGKATVECNAPVTAFHEVVLRRQIPIEAYSVQVSDVQVFVERRESVFNVYLLNPTLILPPPPQRGKHQGLVGTNGSRGPGGSDTTTSNHQEDVATLEPVATDAASLSTSKDRDCETSPMNIVQPERSPSNANGAVSPSQEADHHNEQAKKLVNEMLHAVRDLGRAATRGQLPGAIKLQGLELVDRLRGFRQQDNLEEGLRVMQHVGKVAVESLQNAPKFISPQPDNSIKKKVVYARVGRVVIRDMRIFTKDRWIKASHDDNETNSVNATQQVGATAPTGGPSQIGAAKSGTASVTSGSAIANTDSGNGSWNKPIFIERLVVRASELCPPMSMKDDQDLPAIYQSVDKVAEVVWRRLLAEMAKSNSGKLFSTAMGEVLNAMLTNPNSASAASATGSVAAPPPPSATTSLLTS